MSLYNELIKSNKKTASVMILIYDNKYIMYPMGRSADGKWVGIQKLDCYQNGDVSETNQEEFYDDVLSFLDIAINYDKKGISLASEEDEATKMFNRAKRNKFVGFKNVSINLDFRNENQINIRRHRRISSTEWGANDKDSIFLDESCSKEEFIKALTTQISLANSEVVKR